VFIESSAIRSKSQPRPCVLSGKFSTNKLIGGKPIVATGLIGAVLPPQQRPQWRILGFYRLTIFWGCVSAIDSNGRTIWIADAHRDDGKRFGVHADEKLTAFVELESAIPRLSIGEHNHQDANRQRKESEDGAQDHARVRPCRL